MEKEHYVDAVTAAKFLGINPRYLLQLARAGKLPGHPLSLGTRRSRIWRFRISELQEKLSASVLPYTDGAGTSYTESRQSRGVAKPKGK
jgi:hypothetical protein